MWEHIEGLLSLNMKLPNVTPLGASAWCTSCGDALVNLKHVKLKLKITHASNNHFGGKQILYT
jgi:hypothetical protein